MSRKDFAKSSQILQWGSIVNIAFLSDLTEVSPLTPHKNLTFQHGLSFITFVMAIMVTTATRYGNISWICS